MYFRRMIEFPLFTMENVMHVSGLRLAFRSLDDLRPGVAPALDAICDGIVSGAPFSFETVPKSGHE